MDGVRENRPWGWSRETDRAKSITPWDPPRHQRRGRGNLPPSRVLPLLPRVLPPLKIIPGG